MSNLLKSDKWLLEQAVTIGASGAGVIAGESPYETPEERWHVIRQAVLGRAPNGLKANDDMRRGLLTESLHRELLEAETGLAIIDHDQNQFIYNGEMPWAHALPDGWIDWHGQTIPIQLKCPRARNWHEIKLKGLHGHWLLGAQHSIAVNEAPLEYWSVLNPETMRLIHFPVHREDKIIAMLMQREKAFYKSVLDDEVPFSAEIEKIELPEVGGEMVTLTSEDALTAAAAYREAEDILRDAEALKESAKARIVELMNGHDVCEFPALRVYHREQAGRATFDKKALQKAHPEIDLSQFERVGKCFKTLRAFRLGQ